MEATSEKLESKKRESQRRQDGKRMDKRRDNKREHSTTETRRRDRESATENGRDKQRDDKDKHSNDKDKHRDNKDKHRDDKQKDHKHSDHKHRSSRSSSLSLSPSRSPSQSPHTPYKLKHPRSQPPCEYALDDAQDNEKELILHGTLKDRLNCLALLCARNPSDQNYKQLLQFCENQRNDVIYETLKLLRDLLKEGSDENENSGEHSGNKTATDNKTHTHRHTHPHTHRHTHPHTHSFSPYIKSRIIKSFEMGAKNQYIKGKVVEMMGVLARAEIFTEDFANILVSRLLEKGEVLVAVENALKTLLPSYDKLIFDGITDFYYKNDNFRCQLNVLKFIRSIEVEDLFDFYNTALTTLDESYAKEHRDIMIELLVNGLSRTVSSSSSSSSSRDDRDLAPSPHPSLHHRTVTSIDLIRGYFKSPRSIISVLNLLIKTADPFAETYALKAARTNLLRNTKQEPEFLNLLSELKVAGDLKATNLFMKLVEGAFYGSVPFILGLLVLASEDKEKKKGNGGNSPSSLPFTLHLLATHHDAAVRTVSGKLLRGERVTPFDPFDGVFMRGYRRMCERD